MLSAGQGGIAKQGLRFEIEPIKQIYSSHEGLVFRLTFTAQEKTKICLAKDILAQTQISISRPGKGKIPFKPLILRDNSKLFQQPMKVQWLESGEKLTLRANLKRFQFMSDEQWTPGEYNVDATFNLCEQTDAELVTDPGQEIPIRAVRRGWFMIMI